MSYNLFIDDERYPPKNKEWVICRSSQEAIDYISNHGVPEFISFDHDLGGEDTSMIIIHWLIEKALNDEIIFPVNYTIHSQNPIGATNIKSLMDSFIAFKNNQ